MARFETIFPPEFDGRLSALGLGLGGAVAVPFPPFYDAADFFLPDDYRVTLLDTGPDSPAYATANYTAEQIFDRLSNARANPELTFWIDPQGGNDSTGDGLTEATPWRSITKATTAAMTAGKSVKIKFRAPASSDTGDPIKGYNFVGSSLNALYDLTVDCCLEFYNGAAVMSVHNQFSAPSLHTGATWTYAVTTGSTTDTVLDLTDVDEYAIPRAMQFVPYIESGDIPAGCWSSNGTVTLIRRRDNAPVVNTLCRILDAAPNVRTTNNVSLGFFPATPSDTLRIYGGGNVNGAFDMVVGSGKTDVTPRAVVARNVTCINHSFNSPGAGRCWSINGLHGIAYLENCGALNARSDLYNFHNSRGATVAGVRTRVITINCVGIRAGMDVRPAGGSNIISNNGHTLHEDVRAMDFGGEYRFASGGCVRTIGTSQSLYAGTLVHDRGDRWLGSTTQPTGFRSQDSAEIYCFRTKIPVAGAGVSISYHNGGGAILLRDCWSDKGRTIGEIGDWG